MSLRQTSERNGKVFCTKNYIVLSTKNILSLPIVSPRQCVQRKQYNLSADFTQLFSQAIESEEDEVANLPCGRVYIPLRSQPLARPYIKYIDVTCVLHIVHPKNSSAPTPQHTTSPGVLVLTTLNLVVYASLWMVQTHLYLP